MSQPTFDRALDDGMLAAMEQARGTFGYFWRELHWEYRRIVPGLSLTAIKAVFSDPDTPEVAEQMWVNEIHFDGHSVFGTLLNEPNELKSVSQGSAVQLPLERVSDWMVAFGGKVFGGFTVQFIRASMDEAERAAHDGAWGLNFGDPNQVSLPHEDAEHPMSENMAPKLVEHLAENPAAATSADEMGWTFLHHMALGGAFDCVEVLLEHGADPAARNALGDTPRDLAMRMGWERLIDRLSAA